MRNATLVPALILMSACGHMGKRESDADALARYMDNAAEPVDQFSYFGHFDGWRALGRDKVMIWTGVNDAYLLTVEAPCTNLPYANSIGITSTGSSVTRGFDSVQLSRDEKCRITEIRPIDYKKVREIERAGG